MISLAQAIIRCGLPADISLGHLLDKRKIIFEVPIVGDARLSP
jgi:hypothetical protein